MSHYILFGIILILINLVNCAGADWSKPYFQNPNIDGISFGKNEYDSQIINVREEIPWPFKLAIINYKGNEEPKIGKFVKGNNFLLNASTVTINDVWYVQINNRQDYENEKQQLYIFDIDISNESHEITIVLQNIFDVPPSITYDGPCRVEELKSNFLTNCTFHVYDEDGMQNNKITFKIEGQHGENEKFELKEDHQINAYQTDYNLFIIKELHYEERNSYNFKIFVYDIANNSGNMSVILEVIDVPNMNPVWVKPFVTETFKEKTSKDFIVEAVDGDTGINKPIWYRLEFDENENYANLFSINKTHGILHVNPIDRDTLKQEIFSFKICAYKFDNITWAICEPPAVIIIQDINDHSPEISIEPLQVEFLENTFLNVPLEQFFVDDIDLGVHATYNVTLSQHDGVTLYSEAFDIIPNSGYQKADFRITVHNASLLDYEDPIWRSFDLKIIAQELDILDHRTEKNLSIKLINWNDELPIFEKDSYEVSVLETIGIDQIIANVTATDRDVGDKVIYEIVGHVEGLLINEENGSINTTLNRTFDHERQTSVIIQIRANDTLITRPTDKIHSVYTQLLINVIDVNDKTPEIRMPRKTPNVVENSPGDTLITDMIIATDPDTTATLEFEIDWANTYATKSGQEAKVETYKDCFYIEPKEETRNKVYGLLKINPNFTKFQDVDYEMYDTIYLTIKVTDKMQEVGEPSAEGTLTVRIEDVNDNRPEFILDSLKEKWSVTEEAENGRMIGTVRAIDIDGPPFNIFNYTISPSKDFMPLTPPDVIQIHNETGVIQVKDGIKIDCDIPKRKYLRYVIQLNDGIPPYPEAEIKIEIIDVNNKKPKIEKFNNIVKIWEKSKDGTFVGKVIASDLDRDYPHNALQYSIDFKSFPNLTNYFEINTTNGEIYVKLLGNAILDRDKGEPQHNIPVKIEDNYMGNGIVNMNQTLLTVILLDINDHAPELPDSDVFKPTIKENVKKDVEITDITAPDIDEPNTPNSWVSYKIIAIRPGYDHSENVQNYENLFRIECNDNKTGHIYVNQQLQGYYGKWLVEIEAHDHGEEGPDKIRMSSKKNYTFTVTPYNFHDPEIIYPKSGDVIRLSYRGQQIGVPLLTAEGQQLKSFKAYDPDGGNCGNITFKISSYDPTTQDASYFKMHKESSSSSSLQITKEIQAKRYRLNLVAQDEATSEEGGQRLSKEIKNLIAVFIDMNQEPYFENNNFNTEFTEHEAGLVEERTIPEAIDPKNEGIQNEDEKVKVFYFIDVKYNPDDAKLFTLHKTTRILKLTQILDRRKQETHTIRIVVTNRADGPKGNQDESSLLLVRIKVQGPPIFDEQFYGAGITNSDYTSKVIVTIHASSSNDIVSYSINKNEIIAHGENIEGVKGKIFNLESRSGKLILQEPPTTTMKGYFQFNVTAIDDLNRTDTTNMKIYIVTEANRVKFIFYNNLETVVNQTEFLKNSLKNIYGYDMCNIDEIIKTNSNESQQSVQKSDEPEGITSVRVHFIKNNEAVDASEIQVKSSDITLIEKLKRRLNEKLLYLNDIPQQNSNNSSDKIQNLQTILLSLLSSLLFVICIALAIALALRARAFNRQTKAFTTPDFDLNQNKSKIDYGSPVKITNNILTVEKTNPILNKEVEKDAPGTDNESTCSDDESDFVGIQNDPIFMIDEYVDEMNSKNFDKRIHLTNEKDTDA